MGYSVKPVKSKRRTWRLLLEKASFATGRRVRDYATIPEKDYALHGFSVGMTLDEAKEKAAVANRVKDEIRHAERKLAISKRLEKESDALAYFVPDETAFKDWCDEEHRIEFTGKIESHWKCAKRIIAGLALQPHEYYEKRRRIYRWFEAESYSLAYLKKVIRFLNLYGERFAYVGKSYFKAVPAPDGRDKQDIHNAYRKAGGGKTKSKPLTPALLTAAQSALREDLYNWLYLSLWLGLRPEEVDNLKDERFHRYETDANGVLVLVVYQTKLERSVDEESRWKFIPLLYPEQAHFPELIKSKNFSRPLVKTIRSHIGEGYSTYAGRKGFESLMTGFGQPILFISWMLGHQKLEMTQNYTDRTKARYVLPKKVS
jgi:hypothetical protein